MVSEFKVLGKSTPRKDALEKATGTARFISDIQLPGMLYARYLRSPHAHARIRNIDTSRAESLPGVKCVLTYKNVPKRHPMRKMEFLLDEIVHRPGEEVAAVAALTPEIAGKALDLIEVDYEVLPVVVDHLEAMKPGAPLVRESGKDNIYRGSEISKFSNMDEDGYLKLGTGDVEQGFAEADYIVEGNYLTPMQYNCSPNPRSVVCDWAGDNLTCWGDTQLPLFLTKELAGSFGIPESKVRMISHYSVGGYGGKTPDKTATLTALMAKRTGRPVKSVFSRGEDFIGTHHRISYDIYHKIGVKKDGTITAIYSKIIAPYGSDTGVPCLCQSIAMVGPCNMMYEWKNSFAESFGVLTNMLGYGAMNGFGAPEAIYTVERLMDEAAEKIDMDPVEFRFKNCMRYGDKALEYPQVMNGPRKWGIVGPDLDSFPELIGKCAEQADWKHRWKGWKTPLAVDGHKRQGIGIGIGIHHTTFGPASAIVKMNQDGSATVLSGAVEIGQGYGTALCQVVAEVLGLNYEDVNATLADSGATPACSGNVGSTGTSSPMRAAKDAAESVKQQLFALAAPQLDTTVDNLEARDRKIWKKGTDEFVPLGKLCFTNWQITGSANTPPYWTVKDEKSGEVIHAYAAAATIVEVEVDMKTGKVEILKIVAGHDLGRAINPVQVENQIDLGLVMANGWVRTEEFMVDPKTGVILNPNLLDYKLITFLDMPKSEDVRRFYVEKPCAWGPFGAKGFSETAMTALGPAIANAVYNAIGIRINDGMMTPKNILRAIEQEQGASK